jgi:hypothetical protein
MTIDNSLILSYWNISRNIYYSILFVLPMVFLYELMCWLHFSELEFQIRNGADVFIRQLFICFDQHSELVYSLTLLFIYIMIMYFNRDVIDKGGLKISFLLLMLLESFVWCIIFILLMGLSEKNLLSILGRNIMPEQFYLSIGAGIWEEILFRVGVIGLINYVINYTLGYNQLFTIIIAILSSAILFSLFHYIGELGDIFTFRNFYLRTFAGIILGTLYIFRGFGITAYTHIFYDMAIISRPILMYNN